MLAYTTSTRARAARGWDAFDRTVLWALDQGPASTVGEVTRRLPDGIAYRLIHRALQLACDRGHAVKAHDTNGARYRLTHAGRARITPEQPGQQAAA